MWSHLWSVGQWPWSLWKGQMVMSKVNGSNDLTHVSHEIPPFPWITPCGKVDFVERHVGAITLVRRHVSVTWRDVVIIRLLKAAQRMSHRLCKLSASYSKKYNNHSRKTKGQELHRYRPRQRGLIYLLKKTFAPKWHIHIRKCQTELSKKIKWPHLLFPAPQDNMAAQRTILITGCSRGIGLALAEEYINRGWQVGLAYVHVLCLPLI